MASGSEIIEAKSSQVQGKSCDSKQPRWNFSGTRTSVAYRISQAHETQDLLLPSISVYECIFSGRFISVSSSIAVNGNTDIG
jgi:hypothetical protein